MGSQLENNLVAQSCRVVARVAVECGLQMRMNQRLNQKSGVDYFRKRLPVRTRSSAVRLC